MEAFFEQGEDYRETRFADLTEDTITGMADDIAVAEAEEQLIVVLLLLGRVERPPPPRQSRNYCLIVVTSDMTIASYWPVRSTKTQLYLRDRE